MFPALGARLLPSCRAAGGNDTGVGWNRTRPPPVCPRNEGRASLVGINIGGILPPPGPRAQPRTCSQK